MHKEKHNSPRIRSIMFIEDSFMRLIMYHFNDNNASKLFWKVWKKKASISNEEKHHFDRFGYGRFAKKQSNKQTV